MRKWIVPVLVVLGLAAVIFWTLQNNKEKAAAATPKAVGQAKIPVRVITVKQDTIDAPLSIIGTVQAARDIQLLSETSGRIVDLRVEAGQAVARGQVLAVVDHATQQANYATAKANFEKAKLDLSRYENLRQQNIGTQAQLDNYRVAVEQAEAALVQAQKALGDTRIAAPFSGVLTTRLVDLGTTLAPGTPIGNLVDISSVKVRVNVPESQVFRLNNGDRATVMTDVFPGVTFNGRIESIGVKADESHTYPVDVRVPNSQRNSRLKAGMFARVEFTNLPQTVALTLPREALVGSSREPQVYVMQDSTVKLRKITIGNEVGGRFTIANGLKSGDKVVVSGQVNLFENAPVLVQ